MSMHLKIIDPDGLKPIFVFLNEFFSLKTTVVDDNDIIIKRHMTARVELMYYNGPTEKLTEASPNVLQVQQMNSSTPNPSSKPLAQNEFSIDSDSGIGNAFLRLKALTCDQPAPFCLRVYSSRNEAKQVVSVPITVVRYKLRLEDVFPSVWYKDQGGRDKSIQSNVTLVDSTGQPVRDRSLDLHCVLKYSADAQPEVKDQTILKVNAARIDNRGSALLRIRIDEVSKNHQKQDFAVWVGPADHATHADVAPVVSNAVTVRSKVNPKNAATTSSSSASGRSKGKKRAAPEPSNVQVTMPPLQMMKPNPTNLANAATQMELNSLSRSKLPFGGNLYNVISWVHMTVQGLANMEWQHVAYEVNQEDGSLNPNRPLYRCPCCWKCKCVDLPGEHTVDCSLARSLEDYDKRMIPCLQSLVKMANESATKQAQNNAAAAADADAATTAATSSSPELSDLVNAVNAVREVGGVESAATVTVALENGDGNDDGDGMNGGGSLPTFVPSMSPHGGISAGMQPLLPYRSYSTEQHTLMRGYSTDAYQSSLQIGVLAPQISGINGWYFEMSPNEEQKVSCVLVKETTIGFPAFDLSDELIGFYSYESMVRVLVWKSRAQVDGCVGADTSLFVTLTRLYEEAKGTRDVITKDDCVTLDRLKEQVVLTHLADVAKTQADTLY